MIKAAINPFDARRWLEECCLTRQIIGYRDYDSNSDWDPPLPSETKKLPGWVAWAVGKEYHFFVFANAYTEWQKSVKAPVRPEPTLTNSLGEALTHAGFGAHRLTKGTLRILPDPDECLAKIYEPKKPTVGK
jgi:hypothetical protein